MKLYPCIAGVCALGLTLSLSAQNVRVIPPIGTGTAGWQTSIPWGYSLPTTGTGVATDNVRYMNFYDSTEMPSVGGSAVPIKITRIRCRAVDNRATTTTWKGGTWTGLVVKMGYIKDESAFSTTFTARPQ